MKNFSVIVPIYYGENYIPSIIHQIESCKQYLESQDNIEIIFVNDAPDKPLNVEWQSELLNIVAINTEYNVGIHGARLKGLVKSRGDYVLFLDQDDKIMPEYFKSQLQNIGNGDAVICKALDAGEIVYTDNDIFRNIPSKDFMLKEWNYIVSPGQVLLRKRAIPDTWIKNIMKYNGADDWFLWLCMMADGCRFSLNEDILYEHILHDFNTSEDIMSMLKSEQELIHIIQKEKIFSDTDFALLLRGFFKKNTIRTQELFFAKRKLDVLTNYTRLKEKGVIFSEYLRQLNVHTVAIYGCGILGEFLYQELKNIMDVKCFLDRNARKIKKEIPIYTLQDLLPEVDGIVITLLNETSNVEKQLKSKGLKNIFIFKDWVMNR